MRVYGRNNRRLRLRAYWLLPLGLVGLLGLAVAANAVRQRGHVASGVSVGGVQLGGDDAAAARARLARELGSRLDLPLDVAVGGRVAPIVPSSIGIRIDLERTIDQALAVGRLRGALFGVGYHRDLAPMLALPRSFEVPASLSAVVVPARNARLELARSGAAHVRPAVNGVGFNGRRALEAIARAALAGRSGVRLRTVAVQPAVTTAAAERARLRVARMLDHPIVLQRADGGGAAIPTRRLAPLLVAHTYDGQIAVAFDPSGVKALVGPLVAPYVREPRNARWAASGGKVRVLSALSGIALDADATARHMTRAALVEKPAGRVARIAFRRSQPALTTAKARAMHITDQVSTYTTNMGFSSPNRIHNVHLLADLLDEHVVPPGTVFSFNQAVGPRTAARGFLEGQAIENGQLVPSIGGGVCQVATTVFDAAFLGGYAIVERTNHSFYISHYPLGLDATVSDGGPDFEFRNDSRNPILIETSYTDETLTVTFYSRPLLRKVTYTTSTPTNYTQPPTIYQADDTVAAGQIVQETTGEQGFDVTVSRTVTASNGTVLLQDTFPSHYSPEAIIFGMGPGAVQPGTKPAKGKGTTTGTGTTGTSTTGTSTTGTSTTGTTTTGTSTTGTSTTGTSTTGTPTGTTSGGATGTGAATTGAGAVTSPTAGTPPGQ
jgi:vancomycin resistance protein YoaR